MTVSDSALEARLAEVRLCVLDVDGTLLTTNHRITDATRRAVAAAQAAGLQIMVASSRAPSALIAVLERLSTATEVAVIASQGAILGRYSVARRLEVLSRHPVALGPAQQVVQVALASRMSVSWYSGSVWLTPHVDVAVAREASITGATPVVADLETQTKGPDKIMLISPSSDVAALREIAASLPGALQAQFSNPCYLEITAAGVDKGSTLESFCRNSGIAPSQVLAIGDGPNDLGLFAFAGLGVAPANACPAVLAAADLVTGTNDDNGVAELLNRLLCIARADH